MKPILMGLLGIMAGSIVVAIFHCLAVRSSSTNLGQDHNIENGRENVPIGKNLDDLTLQVIVASEFSREHVEDVCVVCLGEFMEGEGVRLLPECSHAFHAISIDRWVDSHPSCPICRADLIRP